MSGEGMRGVGWAACGLACGLGLAWADTTPPRPAPTDKPSRKESRPGERAEREPAPGKADRPGGKEEEPPREDQLYVWPLPERGRQTLLVLRVIDADTCEAAYLVPGVFKLRGLDPPDPRTKPGKEAAEAFGKLVGGKLLPASLSGRDAYGRVVADFWLGKSSGWAARRMLDGGHGRPLKEK